MRAHHDAAITAAIERYSPRDGMQAIVLIGSLARGDERPDSDVDLYLFTTEEAYRARPYPERLGFGDALPEGIVLRDGIEGVYYDVKVGPVRLLREAVEAANDVARACFDDARVVWSATPEIGEEMSALIERVNNPGDEYWVGHQESFMALAALEAGYFLSEGRKLGNTVMERAGAVHFALAVGRALLALNHVLYRGTKYLERQLAALPIAPPDIAGRICDLVANPDPEAASTLYQEVAALAEWPLPSEHILTRYFEDHELAWFSGNTPVEYR